MWRFLIVSTFLCLFVPSVIAQTNTPTPDPSSPLPSLCITSGPLTPQPSCAIQVNERELGFKIPSLSEVLTFAIRGFFIVAGLVALVFLLLGALSWITSGGDKENVSKAQSKITSAIVGVILIVVVLAIMVTLEQVVFARSICLGLSCPITIPSLLKAPDSSPEPERGVLQMEGQEVVATPTPVPGTSTSGEPTPTTPVNKYNQGTVPK